MNRSFPWLLACAGMLTAGAAPLTESLLFRCRYDQTMDAQTARGTAAPLRSAGVNYVKDPSRPALELRRGFVEYAAAGNLNATAGSVVLELAFPSGAPASARHSLFAWKGQTPDWLVIDTDRTNQTVTVFMRGVNNSLTRLVAPTPQHESEWAQLAVTWELPELRIIWNGSLVGRTELRGVISRPAPSFFVGGGPPSAAAFRVGGVEIFDRALNLRELSELQPSAAPPGLAGGVILQHDYRLPATVVRYALELRGHLDEGHTLRLDGTGGPSVSLPWSDSPTFLLAHSLPAGTNELVLSLVEGNRVLGRITNWACCWPDGGR